MGATPGASKQRKKTLKKSCKIKCGFCPYNQGENAAGKRRPKDDTNKNPRRRGHERTIAD